MTADSREVVFSELRKQGIRPIKVVALDGSKANGEVHGMRNRSVFALVTISVIVAATLSFWQGKRGVIVPDTNEVACSPRHQIYGDPATMEMFEHGEFDKVLERPGDRMLAIFAQPGKLMCAKGANPLYLSDSSLRTLTDYAENTLSASDDIIIKETDPREFSELQMIVNGIRSEFRNYLKNGNGSVKSYWRRLNERTAREIQIYERTRVELENEKSLDVWERKNSELRRLGLLTIANSSEE